MNSSPSCRASSAPSRPAFNAIMQSSRSGRRAQTMRRSPGGRRQTRRRAATVAVTAIASLVVLLVVAGIAVAALSSSFAGGDKIAPHVTVAGVAVGGMTAAQAQTALEQGLAPLTQAE